MSYMMTYYINGLPIIFSDFGIILPVDGRIDPSDPGLVAALEYAFSVYDEINNVHYLGEYPASDLSGYDDDALADYLPRIERAKNQKIIDLWPAVVEFMAAVPAEIERRKHEPRYKSHREMKRSPKRGIVYLLESGGFYKIGMTTQTIKKRVHEIQRSRPEEISIIHTIQSDDIERLESELHNKFNSARKRGEWFELSPSGVDYIKSLGGES